MTAINDQLEENKKLTEALKCLFESTEAGDGDFGGQQREWHLTRLQRASSLMMQLFPIHSGLAMLKMKSPYDSVDD